MLAEYTSSEKDDEDRRRPRGRIGWWHPTEYQVKITTMFTEEVQIPTATDFLTEETQISPAVEKLQFTYPAGKDSPKKDFSGDLFSY